MNDLVVDSKLTTSIVDHQHADTAAAIRKGFIESGPQTALVNDRKTLLDISGFSHSHNTAVITNIEDTVLLEDGTEHVLDNDRGRRVGHEARLLVKLLGEEINSKVAMLTGLSRCGDTNDLARSALKDQQIANADVVAGDRDSVWANGAVDEADALTDTFTNPSGTAVFFINDYLLTLMAMVVRMERMKNTICGFLNAVTEGVVATIIIVVTHVGASGWIDSDFGFDSYLFFSRFRTATLVFDVVGRLDASAIVALGNINFFFAARNFDINFGFCAALVTWFAVAVVERSVSQCWLELKLFPRTIVQGVIRIGVINR